MRKVAVVLALMLATGCVSIIDDLYDDQARSDCSQSRDRAGCEDRVDQNRRDRDR